MAADDGAGLVGRMGGGRGRRPRRVAGGAVHALVVEWSPNRHAVGGKPRATERVSAKPIASWQMLRSGSARPLWRVGHPVEVLPMASLVDQYGPFLRVEEAARLLRISRTSAYVLANRWLDTDGVDGLPAVRIGRSIRIPTVAVERLADPDGTPSLVAAPARRRRLSPRLPMASPGTFSMIYRQVPAARAVRADAAGHHPVRRPRRWPPRRTTPATWPTLPGEEPGHWRGPAGRRAGPGRPGRGRRSAAGVGGPRPEHRDVAGDGAAGSPDRRWAGGEGGGRVRRHVLGSEVASACGGR